MTSLLVPSYIIVKKKTLWLIALIPFLFISDILYGGLDYFGITVPVSPGIIFRGGVLLCAIVFILRYSHMIGHRLLFWIGSLVLSIAPSVLVGIGSSQSVFLDLTSVAKLLYLPLVTCLFIIIIKRYQIEQDELLKFIQYAAYILGFFMLISPQFGIQRESYGDYAYGNKGIFFAGNDITLTLGLALIAAGYNLVLVRFSWLKLILLTLSAYACIQIGTRASLGVLIGVALTTIICLIWSHPTLNSRNSITIIRKIKKWIITVLVLASMSILLLYGLDKQQENIYQQQKLEQIIQGDLPRSLLIQAGSTHIAERSDWYNLIGEGTDSFQRGVASHYPSNQDRKAIEVDWMDIYGAHGFIFTLLIHAFILLVLIRSIHRFVVKRDSLHGLIASASILYLGQSIFAGHALTSPVPTTLMAGYFALFYTIKNSSSRLVINKRFI